MDNEPLIFQALLTVTGFTSVRYIVQEAGNDELPQVLPFCVFATGEKNYDGLATMCGVDPNFFLQEFNVNIYTETSSEGSVLASESIVALAGVGLLVSVTTEFEPDLNCYITVINFS